MARCRVVKGGWSWMGTEQAVGTEIENTPAWIANRVADGLVQPIGDEIKIETATDEPVAETAVSPRGRARRKA